jgi:hypothetical protein
MLMDWFSERQACLMTDEVFWRTGNVDGDGSGDGADRLNVFLLPGFYDNRRDLRIFTFHPSDA